MQEFEPTTQPSAAVPEQGRERPILPDPTGGDGFVQLTPEQRPAEPTPALPQEAEIVDVASLEDQKRERRRAQLREAQRRWREAHPDDHARMQQAYRQTPQAKELAAARQRRSYWRKKGGEPSNSG